MMVLKLAFGSGVFVFALVGGLVTRDDVLAFQDIQNPAYKQQSKCFQAPKPTCGGASSTCVARSSCAGRPVCKRWKCDFKLGAVDTRGRMQLIFLPWRLRSQVSADGNPPAIAETA
jgi:hypothetical protein